MEHIFGHRHSSYIAEVINSGYVANGTQVKNENVERAAYTKDCIFEFLLWVH